MCADLGVTLFAIFFASLHRCVVCIAPASGPTCGLYQSHDVFFLGLHLSSIVSCHAGKYYVILRRRCWVWVARSEATSAIGQDEIPVPVTSVISPSVNLLGQA